VWGCYTHVPEFLQVSLNEEENEAKTQHNAASDVLQAIAARNHASSRAWMHTRSLDVNIYLHTKVPSFNEQ